MTSDAPIHFTMQLCRSRCCGFVTPDRTMTAAAMIDLCDHHMPLLAALQVERLILRRADLPDDLAREYNATLDEGSQTWCIELDGIPAAFDSSNVTHKGSSTCH